MQPWCPALGRGVTCIHPSYVGLGQHFSSSQGMWTEGAFLDTEMVVLFGWGFGVFVCIFLRQFFN